MSMRAHITTATSFLPPSRSAALTILISAAITLALALLLPACTAADPGPACAVAEQNLANTRAESANLRALAAAARSLAQTHAESVRRAARERVADALITLRITITPDAPADADLSDPGAPWSRALADKAAALRARLDTAPIADRPAVAESLATTHPAEIDLASGTPGFDSPRVLRDAVALDTLNRQIESEPSPPVRAALLLRRDALLDPYLPAQIAAKSAADSLSTLDTMLARLDEQSRIADLHAGALAKAANAPAQSPASTALSIYHDQPLRAAILDLVRDAAGDPAAQRVQTRLTRLDAALAPPP